MREIKFRAWDRNKETIITDMQLHGLILIPTNPGWSIAESNEVRGKNPYDNYLYSWSDADVINGRYTPMQYTGLKDKNGVEIYEGDVVLFNTLSGKTMLYEVRWSDHKAGFKPTRLTHTNYQEISVIGNIYENPDILNA